ncbi:MAG: hypothetical protein GY909_08690 [Oligoflexia bacterium]|nr:hypothetical protein [Oligoflexia bacterium]
MANVVFLGKDTGYFQTLREVFDSEYSGESFEYLETFPNDLDTFHKVLIDIKNFKPDIVFLDYGVEPEKVLTIARSLDRAVPSLKSVIGLWDYLSPTDLVEEGNITGVPISHIKSGEVGDVIHHAMYLFKRNKFNTREFAKAEKCMNTILKAHHQMKVGFITPTYAHVEHDLYPNAKAPFKLKTYFGEKFPITHFSIERQLNSNFYYHYKYSSDLKYHFKPISEVKEDETEKEKSWRLAHEKEIEAKRKKQIEEFFDSYPNSSVPKRTKLLIIDSELRVFAQAPKPLDSYPYSIRVYSSLDETPDVMMKELPGVVAVQCPKGSEGDLTKVIDAIEIVKEHKPFVVVFNSHWDTEKLKEHFEYQNIIAHTEDFDFDLVLNLCASYEKSDGRKKSHNQGSSFHNKEQRIYIPKKRQESYIDYAFDIYLNSLTEAYLSFQCEEDLCLLTPYNINAPLRMAFTVIEKIDDPDWHIDGMKQYIAVVHCIGEKEKKALRRKVNQMIQKERESAKASDE